MPLDLCIDVSHYQGGIDWPAVARSGIVVAMIKATEGANAVDPQWANNSAGALAAGLRVIPYHFTNTDAPAAQAANFVRYCTPSKAYALDWEGAAAGTLSSADFETLGTTLQATLLRPPLGYWGIPGSTPGTPTGTMSGWPHWVPRYRFPTPTPSFPAGSTVTPGVPYLFWQYTSSGSIGGINVPVDRSVAAFATAADLLAWCDAPH